MSKEQSTTYNIWSLEHTAWWAHGSCGYTLNVKEAGVYDQEEAFEIVRNANVKEKNEVAFPTCVIE